MDFSYRQGKQSWKKKIFPERKAETGTSQGKMISEAAGFYRPGTIDLSHSVVLKPAGMSLTDNMKCIGWSGRMELSLSFIIVNLIKHSLDK